MSINLNEPTKNDNLQSLISDAAVEDTKQNLIKKKVICEQITFVQDSIEQYINIFDILWCLTRTNCSMMNLKCDLVLQCTDFLDTVLDDIAYTQVSILVHLNDFCVYICTYY